MNNSNNQGQSEGQFLVPDIGCQTWQKKKKKRIAEKSLFKDGALKTKNQIFRVEECNLQVHIILSFLKKAYTYTKTFCNYTQTTKFVIKNYF